MAIIFFLNLYLIGNELNMCYAQVFGNQLSIYSSIMHRNFFWAYLLYRSVVHIALHQKSLKLRGEAFAQPCNPTDMPKKY